MSLNAHPIGVLDSGIGGLTVVRELQRLLPGEDLLYFGDSANCPYGNRSSDEILSLTLRMLRYLEAREIKCAAIACNTISTLVEELRPCFDFPIVSIVDCSADYVIRAGLPSVGLIATEFTVRSGAYDAHIHSKNPDCRIISKGSPTLAALIDRGDFDEAAIDEEITRQVGDILEREPVEDLLLACTHFPIVAENFRRCFPRLRLIDPAEQQSAAVRDLLAALGATNPQVRGRLTICTTGDPAVYSSVSERLGLFGPKECLAVKLD